VSSVRGAVGGIIIAVGKADGGKWREDGRRRTLDQSCDSR